MTEFAKRFRYRPGEVERDLLIVYKLGGLFIASAAGFVALPLSRSGLGLDRRGRRIAAGTASGCVIAGAAMFRWPHAAVRIIRGKPQATAVAGAVAGVIGNSLYVNHRSPAFFPSLGLSATAAAPTGSRNGLAHGVLTAVGAVCGTLLLADHRQIADSRLVGWMYVGAPISYIGAGVTGGHGGDLGLELRAFEETAASEESRADELSKLAENLEAIALELAHVVDAARLHVSDPEQIALLDGVRGRADHLLAEARLGAVEASTLGSAIRAQVNWQRSLRPWSGLREMVDIQPEVEARISDATAQLAADTVARAVANVYRHATRPTTLRITVAFEDPVELHVRVVDDGEEVELEPEDSQGTRELRRRWQLERAGGFERVFGPDGATVHAWTPDPLARDVGADSGAESVFAAVEAHALAIFSAIRRVTLAQVAAGLLIDAPASIARDRIRRAVPLLGLATIENVLHRSDLRGSRRAAGLLLALVAGYPDPEPDRGWVGGYSGLVLADLAWREDPRRLARWTSLVLPAFVAGRRSVPRRKLLSPLWVANNLVSALLPAGIAAFARREVDRFIVEREARIGTAGARVERLERMARATALYHNLAEDLDDLPLTDDLQRRRGRIRERYEAQKEALAKLVERDEPLIDELGDTLARRLAPAEIIVTPGSLRTGSGSNIDQRLAAFTDRQFFRAVVRDLADTLLRDNPPTITGRWGIDSVRVNLALMDNRLEASVIPKPGPRRAEPGAKPLTLGLARIGGSVTVTDEGAINFGIPLDRLASFVIND